MKIRKILKFIGETTANDITRLSADFKGGKTGKNADNIATGVYTPYKNDEDKTENPIEKNFPNLANFVKEVKKDSLKGDKVVSGAALSDVSRMLNVLPLNTDENGDTILPLGNNLRLKQRNGVVFVGFKEKGKIQQQSGAK